MEKLYRLMDSATVLVLSRLPAELLRVDLRGYMRLIQMVQGEPKPALIAIPTWPATVTGVIQLSPALMGESTKTVFGGFCNTQLHPVRRYAHLSRYQV